jgi:hypothetical protein
LRENELKEFEKDIKFLETNIENKDRMKPKNIFNEDQRQLAEEEISVVNSDKQYKFYHLFYNDYYLYFVGMY